MSKKLILQYLKTKKEEDFTALDIVLQKYVNGDLQQLLKSYGYSEIDIFAQIKKGVKSIELNYCYYNIYATIEFNETYLEYCIYTSNLPAEIVDKNFRKIDYTEGFIVEKFFEDMHMVICNSDKIDKVKAKQRQTRIKIFKVIELLSLLIPVIIVAVLGMIVLLTDIQQLTVPWLVVIIFICLTVYIISTFFTNE